MKEVFKDFLTTTLTILNNKNIKIPGSDLNSLCHSIKWIPEFDIDKFWNGNRMGNIGKCKNTK